MIHPVLDLEHWIQRFPLERLRVQARERVLNDPRKHPSQAEVDERIALMTPRPEIITTPRDLSILEQLRRERSSATERTPVDVFVWAEGEPPHPAGTKIGGRPFRSFSRPWPQGHSGPLSFVAQICFADSRDLVRPPADVLLIFVDVDELDDGNENSFSLEWVSLDESDLVTDLPANRWNLKPLHGVRHRTYDLLEIGELDLEDYRFAYCEGTKIGGEPHWIQPDCDDHEGDFLASLGSVGFTCLDNYPLVNREAPMAKHEQDELLMWGDMGALYILLRDGVARSVLECY